MSDEDRFRSWLVEHDYSETTVHTSLIGLRAFIAGKREPWMIASARRIEACFAGEALATQASSFLAHEKAKRPRMRGRMGAVREKPRALDDESWVRLAQVLEADTTPPGRVLDLMGAVGLRIGDTLRIDKAALLAGKSSGVYAVLTKGNKIIHVQHAAAPEQWARLFGALSSSGASTVAAMLSPGSSYRHIAGGGAYQAVRRRLLYHCALLGLSERVWLHRIRKTVADQSYVISGDIMAVKEILGHEHVRTTEHYADAEHLATSTAVLQARRAKFKR